MGNISNPLINRWGLNQFWRRLWYSDNNYNYKLHQDTIFNKLVYCYLNYGIFHSSNIFNFKRWDVLTQPEIIKDHAIYNSQYFRTMYFKSAILEKPAAYQIRLKIKNIYLTKIWIFRYQNWLVINFYAYQPVKINKSKIKSCLPAWKQFDFLILQKLDSNTTYKRVKLLLFYLFFRKQTNNYYKF